ncbi:MAG: hypothetical protein KDA45_00420, partial [Planctomycetales bacterium]|nr:hypothetical protein [Planctomycetales bacterium]
MSFSANVSPWNSVRDFAQRLQRCSERELCDQADGLREAFHRGEDRPTTMRQALGLANEALRRTLQVDLYDVQLQAAWATSQGHVTEMQTGEGKTLAVGAAAMLTALQGETVHVATPNAYLAHRDFSLLQPAFQTLGISAGWLSEGDATRAARVAAYDCDITYGTGCEFGFDFLRDQVDKQLPNQSLLGSQLFRRLRGLESGERVGEQRGHGWAIIDEVDNVLLDDAGSPLILCDAPPGEAEDAQACRAAAKLACELAPGECMGFAPDGMPQLNDRGLQRIHAADVRIPVRQLRRPWREYVLQALQAKYALRRDVHYVLEQQAIRLVDASTGRIFSDRSWSEGLHQAVEAKEGLPISAERSILAQVTRQRYFRLYRGLSGMTGTAAGGEREFRQIYRLPVSQIPPRLPNRRQLYPTRAFAQAEAKWQAIVHETRILHARRRPVLLGTRTIQDSELLAERLQQQRLDFHLLNGKQDADEAAIVAQAGRLGAITIATNMAGRGTDIQLDTEARRCGGLHVIVCEPHELQRVDRQLVGRGARQGDPGSARMFVSADDLLLHLHAPWLQSALR